ncbi:LapA family protein [Streptococcus suis]|uniref:LapA family protein n=1 Tax=Streptococcus suis TaxID=1307 RepID=UPI001ABDAF8F|nr:LapA family protein [Streptococcus suis]
MKQKLSLIGLIFIIILTVILSLANRQVVVVNYLFGHFRMPLILVILGSLLVGLFIQYLLGMTKNLSLKSEIKSLKKELIDIRVLQNEENSDKINQIK